MDGFIEFFPAQKQVAQLPVGQPRPNKVLVNFCQLRLQAVRIADGTLNLRPAQQLRSLQSVQASNKRVVLGDGDGIHQAHGGNAPGQFLHVPLLGVPPPWVDFDFADFHLHGNCPQCENTVIMRLSISRSEPSSDSASLRRKVISAEFNALRSRWNHSATLTPP